MYENGPTYWIIQFFIFINMTIEYTLTLGLSILHPDSTFLKNCYPSIAKEVVLAIFLEKSFTKCALQSSAGN